MAYRFGDFILDPRTGTLCGPDGPVSLRRQAFLLCEVLLRHAPDLLDRDTLLNEVWGRTALSANVLPQTISELRHALGDDPQAPKYIETVHRRGYRMVCPVAEVDASRAESEAGTVTGGTATEEPPALRRWPARIGLASTIVVVALLIALFYGNWQQESEWRRLHAELVPEIRALIREDLFSAWKLAREARERFPDDPVLAQLWRDLALPVSLDSEPPGAEVAVKAYTSPAGAPPGEADDWIVLGHTPIKDLQLPLTMMRFRLTLAGHETLEAAPSVLPVAQPFHLHPADASHGDLVFVRGGPAQHYGHSAVVPDFWIGRHEVTNREYREFILAGGYEAPRFWKQEIIADGRALSWREAMDLFVDSTGMPGPAGWAMGTYPPGEDDHPVEGVSWYEAAAYAEYAGLSLPTVFHWWRAAGFGTGQVQNFSDILAASNFSSRGAVPVGSMGGLGPHGTFDMAGNVAEWAANAAGSDRHALGGSWLTDVYAYHDQFAQPAIERRAGFGFRLMRPGTPLAPEILRDIPSLKTELPAPVDDATFAFYTRLFEYDPAPLEAVVSEVDEEHEAWRREKVIISTAYGGERMPVLIFLPRDREPPYQAVVFVPGGDAVLLDSSEDAGLLHVEALLRSGRAVVYPVYKGTFERKVERLAGPIDRRNLLTQQVKDLRRTLDYLETRDDLDASKIALYGLSYGGSRAPYMLAVEDRFATAIIMSSGISPYPLPREIRMQDYLARVRVPVLFITGRKDFNFPFAESQRPFFELLGTPDDEKRHVALDWGHLPPGYADVVRELLAWLDRWLGKP